MSRETCQCSQVCCAPTNHATHRLPCSVRTAGSAAPPLAAFRSLQEGGAELQKMCKRWQRAAGGRINPATPARQPTRQLGSFTTVQSACPKPASTCAMTCLELPTCIVAHSRVLFIVSCMHGTHALRLHLLHDSAGHATAAAAAAASATSLRLRSCLCLLIDPQRFVGQLDGLHAMSSATLVGRQLEGSARTRHALARSAPATVAHSSAGRMPWSCNLQPSHPCPTSSTSDCSSSRASCQCSGTTPGMGAACLLP